MKLSGLSGLSGQIGPSGCLTRPLRPIRPMTIPRSIPRKLFKADAVIIDFGFDDHLAHG